jgi:serine/threonine protein kinase
MIGRTVSHYRILSPLGSGGMGVVYLAEDARLGRQVALKFLPASYAREAKALERFRVEARAASSLTHPAICAIYDIGQDGDTPFIVMEALKGETLRERIAKGPLKVPEVLDIGIQLADALEAAHLQGIVHRDIKPANIFLSDRNRVKVLDFGLAKLTSSPSSLSSASDTAPAADRTHSNQMTQPGTALGTVSYMSPEQARGEHIDSRTDLFSLGAVMYEMLTGSQAFGGSTTAVVYDTILNRAPRPIADLNPLVPPRLEAVIATALEKERDLRYQHASELQAELRRIRRDIDTGSLVASHPLKTTRRDKAPASPGPGTVPAGGTGRWLERSSIVVAALAILVASVLFWRGQGTEVERSAGQPAPAPANPSAQTPGPGNVPPPIVETPATTPTQSPPATASTEPAARPAPQPQPRVAPAPPRPEERAFVPPPQAATPAPAPPAQPEATTAPSQPAVNPPATSPEVAPPPEEVKPLPSPPLAAEAPRPEPVAPSPPVQPATPPARAAAVPEPAPSPPVESDEAAIRRVIRIYEQAIETEDIALYRSVRPGLTRAAETVLMNSFREIDSQEIDIRIESLRIDGRTATARIARRDTLTTAGRRQTQNSTQTLRFAKSEAGWIIAE